MIKINENVLKQAAKNLMFEISNEECQTLIKEFDTIIKQMETLDCIKGLDEVSPMTFPFECSTSFLREDVCSEPLSAEEALKNAKDVVDNQIRLPKVVG